MKIPSHPSYEVLEVGFQIYLVSVLCFLGWLRPEKHRETWQKSRECGPLIDDHYHDLAIKSCNCPVRYLSLPMCISLSPLNFVAGIHPRSE